MRYDTRAYITRASETVAEGGEQGTVGNEGSWPHASEKQAGEIDEFVSERIEARGKAFGCAGRILFPDENKKRTRAPHQA